MKRSIGTGFATVIMDSLWVQPMSLPGHEPWRPSGFHTVAYRQLRHTPTCLKTVTCNDSSGIPFSSRFLTRVSLASISKKNAEMNLNTSLSVDKGNPKYRYDDTIAIEETRHQIVKWVQK